MLLDKPFGVSSNAALQRVKHLYQACKAGHTGSLDPLATGLLPICLGEATKVSGLLLDADKSYAFTCKLGVTTRTGDAEGEVIATRPVGCLTLAAVAAVLERFRGELEQVPPMYSALKHQGQPLYRLARRNISVERQPRRVSIRALRLVSLEGDALSCEARCSKGTYIRTLAEDIGEALGCGAHVTALRRTAVEPYACAQALTLDNLAERAARGLEALDAALLPLDSALGGWPAVYVPEDSAHNLRSGQAVWVPQAPSEGWVRLYEAERRRLLGVGEMLEDGRVAPRRLLQS